MKFARIILLLVVVLCLLGSSQVEAAKKKKKNKSSASRKAEVTTADLDTVLGEAELADGKARPTPEEAQANLNAAIEKAEKEAEVQKAADKAKAAKAAAKAAKNKPPPAKKGAKKKTKDWSKISEADLEKAWEQGDEEEELTHEYDHSQKIIEKKKQQVRQEQIRKAQAKAKKGKGKAAKAPQGGDDMPADWQPPFDMTDPDQIAAALATQDEKMGGMLEGNMPGINGAFTGAGMKPGDDLDALNSFTGTAMYFVDLLPMQPEGKDKGKPWDKKTVDNLAGYWASMLKSGHLGANVYNLGATNKDGQMLLSIDKGWQTREILTYIFQQPAVVKLTKDRQEFTRAMFATDDDDDL